MRQYFEKISIAEKGPPASMGFFPMPRRAYRCIPERAEIDKAAAGRFIKHAITQAKYGKTPSDTLEPTPTTSTFVEPKVTSKMLERQQYEKDLQEQDAEESEEAVLEGFEDGDVGMEIDVVVPSVANKGKGKSKEALSAAEESPAKSNKRRRPAIDPFAGTHTRSFYTSRGWLLTHFRIRR